jgi:uncharacterized protein YaaW (UPF0174 family)/transcriptional regulator with XRE-family HTH domain
MLIKEIRDHLGLSQEQLASILSVTQATVARWESGVAQSSGITAFKIRQLSVTLANPTERQMVADILDEPGGVATLAALLTLGSSFEKAADSMGIPSLFAPSGVSASNSALTFLRVLSKIVNNKQRGERTMSELPLRESDADLVPLLRKCTNDDLDPLVQYILQKGWLSSELEITEVYKKNQPNHVAYVDEICSEIQRFGGHTFANLLRGGEGVTYKRIVCAVAKRLKVNFNEKREVEIIEEQILLKILEKAWEKMTDEEKAQLRKAAGAKGVKIGKEFPLAALLALFKAGGFKSYVIMYTVANAVSKFVIGKGLKPLANAALAQWAKFLMGPIGWAITFIWALFDLGGPAYRVTIPCVIHIAMLRRLVALRDAGQDPTKDASDTPV